MSRDHSRPTPTRQLGPGDTVPAREVTTLSGSTLRLPADDGLTHLQFRRFAGCPLCNVHLGRLARRHDELVAAGICEVAAFHSPAEAMRPHQGDLPFAVLSDPDRVLYDEFGVQSSIRANLHPKAWTAPLRAQTWVVVARGLRAGAKPGPQGDSMVGLPADFLIAPDGTILAAHYGSHANDQWSVEELLRLATALRTSAAPTDPGAAGSLS